MIKSDDLVTLYNWAKNVKFPVKKAPTIDGYSNKVIDYYWIKSVKKTTIIRDKLMTDEVLKIYQNKILWGTIDIVTVKIFNFAHTIYWINNKVTNF